MAPKFPFNQPHLTGNELHYISDAHAHGQLAGDGSFTQKCHQQLEESTGAQKVLLTHSCTAALEMAALLADIQPGDEVIMPSYTFVSTANAFVLRGGVPVFVDIRPDTLNLNEQLIEQAITSKTKGIVPVHYAGVACEMDAILEIAQKHDLFVIEDAAQGVQACYKGKALGTLGDLGCFSFHETKNVISGEGGALLVNRRDWIQRAEIVREKGTNRSQFFRGQVDKYTWVEAGSSYLPGEIIAAFLWAQLQEAESITQRRLEIWKTYHTAFEELESKERLRRPIVPKECQHNGHMYYLLLRDLKDRSNFIENMKEQGVNCVFHYVPLHSSPAGKKYGRVSGSRKVTDSVSERLVRLPLWVGLEPSLTEIIDRLLEGLKS